MSATDASGEVEVGTVRSLFDNVSRYAKSDDERELLDLAFRTAFGLHPDYWHEFTVLVTQKDEQRQVGEPS